ncbi:hypothetical protein BKA61DRAFT_573845 [Leptodontidium sp. MPI-SDFR-AT-0119]|nr:hypothetical protein BKA61DRAFT_573845 [Leptodontidium sp. MPI-SDFR-AT-0119]
MAGARLYLQFEAHMYGLLGDRSSRGSTVGACRWKQRPVALSHAGCSHETNNTKHNQPTASEMVVLIGGLVLQRHPYPSNTTTWNDDSDNSSYTLTDAPVLFLVATTPPDSPYIKLVHEAGDASAV